MVVSMAVYESCQFLLSINCLKRTKINKTGNCPFTTKEVHFERLFKPEFRDGQKLGVGHLQFSLSEVSPYLGLYFLESCYRVHFAAEKGKNCIRRNQMAREDPLLGVRKFF